MSTISVSNIMLARFVAKSFGGKPKAQRFWDESESNHIDIITCYDRPQTGISSYSTVGLSDYPLIKDGSIYPARVEFVGACSQEHSCFDNVLATAAFCVINSKWFCYPGAIFDDILKMYYVSSTMQHLFFEIPFLWNDSLKTLNLENKTVDWLLVIPISDKERDFAEKNGSESLADLFEKKQIDIFDLERESII